MLKIGWFGMLRGHPRSLKIALLGRAHTTSYWLSIVTVPLSCTVSENEILVEKRRCELPHLYLAPSLGVMSLEFRQDFWHRKTRFPGLSYAVLNVILGS